MEDEDFSSDSSDEDYVPTELQGLSEEEESGEDEDLALVDGDNVVAGKRKKSKKGNGKTVKSAANRNVIIPRKRKGGIRLESETPVTMAADETKVLSAGENDATEDRLYAQKEAQEQEEKKAMAEKAKADLLWSDFMKDVSKPIRPVAAAAAAAMGQSVSSCDGSTCARPTSGLADKKGCVEIVKEYKFAGETVKLTTTVEANSKEAKQGLMKLSSTPSNINASPSSLIPSSTTSNTSSPASSSSSSGSAAASSMSSTPVLSSCLKRPATGGLNSVLGKIGKMPKMSTLIKSKLDWEGFKSAEGIDDDLKIHNRGKSGYLERQAFLERTDHRQFEIEKSLRLGSKPK